VVVVDLPRDEAAVIPPVEEPFASALRDPVELGG
jgi:hypothetical protein